MTPNKVVVGGVAVAVIALGLFIYSSSPVGLSLPGDVLGDTGDDLGGSDSSLGMGESSGGDGDLGGSKAKCKNVERPIGEVGGWGYYHESKKTSDSAKVKGIAFSIASRRAADVCKLNTHVEEIPECQPSDQCVTDTSMGTAPFNGLGSRSGPVIIISETDRSDAEEWSWEVKVKIACVLIRFCKEGTPPPVSNPTGQFCCLKGTPKNVCGPVPPPPGTCVGTARYNSLAACKNGACEL